MKAGKSIPRLLRKIAVLPRLLKDPSVSLTKKTLLLGGIAYLISPVDIIADPILGLGIIDDAVLLVYIINKLTEELESYLETENQEFDKDKIINQVEYRIDDDDSDK